MRARLRRRLTYANLMATVAVFLVLGGASWAAVKLPRNSVGPRQIKPNAVSLAKVAPAARASFKGARGEKGERGPVGPVATAEPPQVLAPADSAQEPRFLNGGSNDCIWSNWRDTDHSVGAFLKDPSGIVRIKGLVKAANGPGGDGSCAFGSSSSGQDVDIFVLPVGYRPAQRLVFRAISDHKLSRINVDPDGEVSLAPAPGNPNAESAKSWISLEGMSFRAEQ